MAVAGTKCINVLVIVLNSNKSLFTNTQESKWHEASQFNAP